MAGDHASQLDTFFFFADKSGIVEQKEVKKEGENYGRFYSNRQHY